MHKRDTVKRLCARGWLHIFGGVRTLMSRGPKICGGAQALQDVRRPVSRYSMWVAQSLIEEVAQLECARLSTYRCSLIIGFRRTYLGSIY